MRKLPPTNPKHDALLQTLRRTLSIVPIAPRSAKRKKKHGDLSTATATALPNDLDDQVADHRRIGRILQMTDRLRYEYTRRKSFYQSLTPDGQTTLPLDESPLPLLPPDVLGEMQHLLSDLRWRLPQLSNEQIEPYALVLPPFCEAIQKITTMMDLEISLLKEPRLHTPAPVW